MKYKVNIQETEEGYTVWAPEFPSCWAQGITEDEALENIKTCIKESLKNADRPSNITNTRYVEVDID